MFCWLEELFDISGGIPFILWLRVALVIGADFHNVDIFIHAILICFWMMAGS
jgi:hypothetical protein